jgi:DNA-binding NtrC family response regulator
VEAGLVSREKKRVFVVDDEPLIASTLALILQRKGFETYSYTDPRLALAASKTLAPDLLISDVSMPDVSGIELAIYMSDQHPGCLILLFSGEATTTDLLRHAREDGHDFLLLTKPIHPSDLLGQISSCFQASHYQAAQCDIRDGAGTHQA